MEEGGIPVMCNGKLGWKGRGVMEAGPTATLLLGVLTHHTAMCEAQRLKNTCECICIFIKYMNPKTLRY